RRRATTSNAPAARPSWLNFIVRAWRRGRRAGVLVAVLAAATATTGSPAGAALAPSPGLAAVPAAVREAGPLRVHAWGGGLVDAMLLPSGCDAAYLLATSYGPGRNAFIAKMNVAARAMGLAATHFSHYDGMPYPTEYSTYASPADLIRLGEQAMRLPLFRRI